MKRHTYNLIDYLTDLLKLNSEFDEIIKVTNNYDIIFNP